MVLRILISGSLFLPLFSQFSLIMVKDEINVAQAAEAGGFGLIAEAAVKAVKAGRAKDVDIAAQIIAEHGQEMEGESWSVAEEKKLIRKVDWMLIPIVSAVGKVFCVCLSFVD